MTLLDTVLVFAIHTHAGQKDKADKPYILHLLRVMLNFEDEKEQIVAILHDSIEDQHVTIE